MERVFSGSMFISYQGGRVVWQYGAAESAGAAYPT